MKKQDKLKEIQKYSFAAYDLLLYLDTHPQDKRAFTMFKELVEKLRSEKAEYEKQYGPLQAFNSADFDKFRWLESPWPWEKEDNA